DARKRRQDRRSVAAILRSAGHGRDGLVLSLRTRIAIVLFDGFDELDAIGPFEVLSNAARAGAPIDVDLVGSSGPGEIVASHGLRVTVTGDLQHGVEILVVPGGGWNGGPGSPGARAEVERGTLPSMIAA